MLKVIIPLIFLIGISIFKKIPKVGGNLIVAFVGAGLLALGLGGAWDPRAWFSPWMSSLDSVAFIVYIVLFGSVFSLLQTETGAMETVLNILRALFGRTAKGLVFASLVALYFGGALMGTVAAVGAVIGLLIVPSLDDMDMDPDLICAIIVTGASMGGMMPPVSNAVILSCSLLGIDATSALLVSYITVGIGLVVISWFFCRVYVGDRYQIPESAIPKESAWTIFRSNGKRLIPLAVLIVLVMLNSIPAIKFDFAKALLNLVKLGDGTLYTKLSKVPFLGKLLNNIVTSMLVAIVTCFLVDRGLAGKLRGKLKKQLRQIVGPEIILVVTAFFLGSFKLGGQNAAIAAWAESMNSPMLLMVGGSAAIVIAGMLTGGQSTAQTMLIPLISPAWSAIGMSATSIALVSSHMAMAGQGLPPADMNTFIIAGLLSGLLGKKVDPLRSMYYSAPYCIYLILVGAVFFMIKL